MNRNRKPRDRSLTPEQRAEVLRAADGDMRGLILVAMTTGQRIADIIALKSGDVDFTKEIICFNIAKTGVALGMPLDPLVRAWIEQQPRSTKAVGPETALFPQLAQQDACITVALLHQLGKKAGVVVGGLSFRHGLVGELLSKGTPISVVYEMLGYRSRS